MKYRAYMKELSRSIYNSKARFFSILTIIAIGVGFFAGINATEPDMILSANKYYKDKNLADFRVIAPLGFQETDIEKINQIEEVEHIQQGYFKDLFITSPEGYTSISRLYSYDQSDFIADKGMNKFVLEEGRLPEKPNEMVVQAGGNVPAEIKIGSEVTLKAPNDEELSESLNEDTFIIVGTISSPMYISYERGQTNIGDGSIDFYAYIHTDAFQMERRNDVYIQTVKSKELTAYTEKYDEYLQPIQSSIEHIGELRMEEEIAQMEKEISDNKKELKENKEKAEQELAEAEQSLIDSEKEVGEAEQQLDNKEKEYEQTIEENLAQIEEGEAQLKASKKAYEEKLAEWEASDAIYEQGKTELNQTEQLLQDAEQQLDEGEKELEDAKLDLDHGKEQLESLGKSLDSLQVLAGQLGVDPPSTKEEYLDLIDSHYFFQQEMEQQLKSIDYRNESSALLIITAIENTILPKMENQYSESSRQYEEGLRNYNVNKKELEAKKEVYEEKLAQFGDRRAELNTVKEELDKGKQELDSAKRQLEDKERELEEGRKAIEEGREQLFNEVEKGEKELEEAKEEISEGWESYEEEKNEIYEGFQELESEIEKAEEAIQHIPKSWVVSNRDANPGYTGYGEDANRIGAVAKVFPLFFFLVAALVSLTTMSRMIEEERRQIGTLKALGYGPLIISCKYLFYALASSFLGCIVGLSVGFWLFPTAIMNAYDIMYAIPVKLTPFHWNYAIISTVIALFTTVLTAFFATIQELKSDPATLMQPRAPKPGKRIFLEKITSFWNKLNFSQKVTFRNLFRYKNRFYMTIFGISGCTALLIAGFGLSDSINDVMGKQYTEIFHYDGQIVLDLKEDMAAADLVPVLDKNKHITSYLGAYNESVDALPQNSDRAFEATITVPSSSEALNDFVLLQERTTDKDVTLPLEGAILSEKLASLLDVTEGDTFTYRDGDNRTYELEVAGLTENYLSHYIYVSPSYVEKVTGNDVVYNAWMFQVENTEVVHKPAFKEKFMQHDEVMAVYFNEDIATKYEETMESLDFVVFILIISAAALAFVVLYNLTNINITERMREIATIKVLGFKNKEVDAYVYRENFILIVLGTILGLVLGNLLHQYVIITMEIDTVMFGRQIHFSSYIWSIILTIVFSTSVNFFMHFKLKRINMVQSLKSVD